MPYFLSFSEKKKIREVVLDKCERCQELFAPNPQIEKIYDIIQSKGGIAPERKPLNIAADAKNYSQTIKRISN